MIAGSFPVSSIDVLGLGESSVDYVYRVPRLPRPGAPAKVPISAAHVYPGGQVATALCACAALGLRTAYVGAFGADANGRLIRGVLEQRGVDTAGSVICPGSSRYAVILVEEGSGERVVFWHRDPAVALAREALDPALIASARLLHVDAVDEDVSIAAAHSARRAGIPVTTDIDAATNRTRDLLAAATAAILGEGVAETLAGTDGVEDALRALRRDHAGLLCVTLGARGAVLLEGDVLHHVEGHRVAAVDTTGAGDVFRGAFIYALLRGDAPAAVLRFANAAAAVSCTREGAIDGVPTLPEIERLLTARS